MANYDRPQMSATFTPGSDQYYDYTLPAPTNIAAPAPQRVTPELPGQLQHNLSRLDLNHNPPSNSQPYPHYSQNSQGVPQPPQPSGYDQPSQNYNPPPQQHHLSVYPSTNTQYGPRDPNIPLPSDVPRLPFRTPNVPESDQERGARLDRDRLPMLSSQNFEEQLAWAQEVLEYVDASAEQDRRLATLEPPRPSTPPAERQMRTDALNIIHHMASQDHPRALFIKGTWLEFGRFGMPEDHQEAFKCFSKASRQGFARAEYRIGMQFESTNQPQQAIQHYRTGESQGDSACCYRMGMIAALGQLGQGQDFARAAYLIKYAADTADANAPQGAYVWGMLQVKDLPQINIPDQFLRPDVDAGKYYIERAALLGFSKAQFKMGSAYELGSLHCEVNPALSMHYYALAAKQGEPEAELALSKWFLVGYEGVFIKNDQLAYKYAQRAAQSELPTALLAMGYMYEVGIGAPRNLEQAKAWYQRAAAGGSADAVKSLERLSSNHSLSMKDHENVAISRIKSTHGSMRGNRPPRLRQQNNPMPTVPDESGPDYRPPQHQPSYPPPGNAPQPAGHPPNSAHQPPRGGPTANYPARASSSVPYPTDDSHQQTTPYPSMDGPVAQPYQPPYTEPSYQIQRPPGGGQPNSRPDAVAAARPYPQHPPGPQGPPGGQGPGMPPGRQYQGYNEPLTNRPPPNRYPTAPTAGPGPGPGPQNAMAPVRPPKDPLRGNTMPHQQLMGPPQPAYAHPPPSQTPPNFAARPPPSATPPASRPPPQNQGTPRPSNDSRPGYRIASGTPAGPTPQSLAPRTDSHASPRPNSRPSSPYHQANSSAAAVNAARPSGGTGLPPKQQAASRPPPPHKGPQTFDQMGVPAAKQDGDCVLM